MIKERTTIRVGGNSVVGDAATVSFTSDTIFFKDVWQLSLNFYFIAPLAFTGQRPTITIEESNDRSAGSFVPIEGATDVIVPEFFKNFKTTSEYIRIVYDAQGATGGTIGVQTRIIKP